MLGLNRVILSGYLTKAPQKLNVSGDRAGTILRIAINRPYTKNGERQTEVTFVSVVCWGALATTCIKYLSKGSPLEVEGRLRSNSWEDKEGGKRYTLEVIASNICFAGTKPKSETKAPVDEAPVTAEPEIVDKKEAEDVPIITSEEGDFSDVPF